MRGLTRHTHGFFSNSAICSLVNIVLIVSFVSELILTKENNGTVPFVSTLWGTDHGGGGGNRTPVVGFGDQHHTTRPRPRMRNDSFVFGLSQLES